MKYSLFPAKVVLIMKIIVVLLITFTVPAVCNDYDYEFPGNCSVSPCTNFGICHELTKNTARCFCPFGYTGRFCEHPDCRCLNGGQCRFVGAEKACFCSLGFYGRICEKACSKGADGVGDECEAKRFLCESNVCFNGGTCLDEVDGFRCECGSGFNGRQCETKLDPCKPQTCENGATCVNRLDGFECLCTLGYNGERCQKKIDNCRLGLCLNGGTCINKTDSFSCACSNGFSGNVCQHQTNFEEYNRTDILERELCRTHECDEKAGDGVCNLECNYYACRFDGGDCSAKIQPFSRCPSASFCAHNFYNQKCDEICNVEECLFDGYDCDDLNEICIEKKFCAKVYGDGVCDAKCNNSACGWDGGDCKKLQEASTTLDGDVILILLLSKQEFLQRSSFLLLTLSQSLRATVSIKLQNGTPMVYDWNLNSDVGLPTDLLQDSFLQRPEHLTAETNGTLIVLTVDVSQCQKNDEMKCFGDIISVANYLGAATAKQSLGDFGAPIYASVADTHPPKESFAIWEPIFISGIFFVFVVSVIIQQTCKRKIVHAPIWHPPTEAELYKMRFSESANFASTEAQFHGHCIDFNSAKRMRCDLGDGGKYFAPSDSGQWTALHGETASQDPVTVPIQQLTVNEKDKNGMMALILLAVNKSESEKKLIKDLEALLDAGADISIIDESGDSALMLAVKSSWCELVEFLLARGANPNQVDSQRRTPLHHAVAVCCAELVRMLLNAGVKVNAWDASNRSALIYSAQYTFTPKIATMLLEAKADPACAGDISRFNYNGRTALHYASQLGNVDVLKVLVDYAADKNVQDFQGRTPLFLAALEGQIRAVELLLNFGATQHICDETGRLPRDIAAERCYFGVVDLLDKQQPCHVSRAAYTKKPIGQRKVDRKTNLKKMERKNSVETVSSHLITPPFSDESNFSTTPSPSSLYGNMRLPLISNGPMMPGVASVSCFNDQVLRDQSVMLSPHCGTYDNNDWRPQQDIGNMTFGTPNWSCVNYPYDEHQVYANNYSYPVPQNPSHFSQGQFANNYCNV